jgi:peptide chain release factor
MEKYIQITAGKGPAECQWVVAQVLKFIIRAAQEQGLEHEILHREEGVQNRTLCSVLLSISGSKASTLIKEWEGSVQWIGQSPFRKYHKRKNWFIGVQEVKQEFQVLDFKESDLKIETSRSGGPGGQHANKVNTAVRLTHLPSGISIRASDTRSQAQNKKLATQRLKLLLQQKKQNEMISNVSDNWKNHNSLERGNPIKVFQGSDFKTKRKDKSNKQQRAKLKQAFRREME